MIVRLVVAFLIWQVLEDIVGSSIIGSSCNHFDLGSVVSVVENMWFDTQAYLFLHFTFKYWVDCLKH